MSDMEGDNGLCFGEVTSPAVAGDLREAEASPFEQGDALGVAAAGGARFDSQFEGREGLGLKGD